MYPKVSKETSVRDVVLVPLFPTPTPHLAAMSQPPIPNKYMLAGQFDKIFQVPLHLSKKKKKEFETSHSTLGY